MMVLIGKEKKNKQLTLVFIKWNPIQFLCLYRVIWSGISVCCLPVRLYFHFATLHVRTHFIHKNACEFKKGGGSLCSPISNRLAPQKK